MQESEIRFDPPAEPLPTDLQKRQQLAQALREVPGKWVLVGAASTPNRARSHAHELRRGGSGWDAFGPDFEAETHHMLGENRVYARYVGTIGGLA